VLPCPCISTRAKRGDTARTRKGNSDYTPKYDFGPGTYGKPGLFDSQGDQRAISSGFLSTPKGVALWHKEQYEAWPTYNPK
jgi:hypothetical protein